MKRLMGIILTFVSASLVAAALAGDDGAIKPKDGPLKMSPKPDVDLSGFYECSGEDSAGKKYSGVCHVVQVNQVHIVTWLTGGASFSGVGLTTISGDKTVFSVSWAIAKEGQIMRGINVYAVSRREGKLHMVGFWATAPGNGQRHRETLKWLKESKQDDE